jgi:hypothetical protein
MVDMERVLARIKRADEAHEDGYEKQHAHGGDDEDVGSLLDVCEELLRERDELFGLLERVDSEMTRGWVFIRSREQLHLEGQEQYSVLLQAVRDRLQVKALEPSREEVEAATRLEDSPPSATMILTPAPSLPELPKEHSRPKKTWPRPRRFR